MSAAELLAEQLRDAVRVAVFTGAGISTESGIPDFRSPGGVWSQMKPIIFQDFLAREDMQREAWRRVFAGAMGWTGAAPNAGHFAVARLVEMDKAFCVITQNVDDLHRLSGVPAEKIVELHGNATYAKCLGCARRYELEELRPGFVERGEVPICTACGGLIKTATISFGQPMPEREMARADAAARACDLCLALGSSLVVTPAATIPLVAVESGARLVILNREPTPLDRAADLALHQEIGPTLTAALRLIN